MVPLLAVQGEADPRDRSSVASCSAYLGPGQVWESWPCIRTNSVRDQLKTNSVRDQLKRLIVPLWLWEKQIPMIPFCCWLWFVCLGWHLKVYFSLKKIELCLLSFSLLKYYSSTWQKLSIIFTEPTSWKPSLEKMFALSWRFFCLLVSMSKSFSSCNNNWICQHFHGSPVTT